MTALALLCALTGAPHEGHAGAHQKANAEAQEIEEVEAVDAAPVATAAAQPAKLAQLVGYFHSAAVHMPIAWLLLLVLVDLATFALKRPELAKIGYLLLALTVASFVPGIVTGLVRLENMALEPEPMQAALDHRNVMFFTAGAVAAALVVRWRARNLLAGPLLWTYLLLVLLAGSMVIRGGHLGGAMIFGNIPF